MKRRTLLGVGALALAGCTAEDEGTPTDATTPTDPTRTTETATRTPREVEETPGEEPADATVELQELVAVDRDGGTEYALTGTVTNTGEIFLADLSVTATFRKDGEVLDAYTMAMNDVGVGETWEVWMPMFGDAVPDEGTLEVAGWNFPYWSEPGGLAVVDDELVRPVDETGRPSVVGRARNDTGGDLGIVEVRVTFYGENGNILAGHTQTTSPLPAGEEWAFTATAHSYNAPAWNDRIVDYAATVVAVP